MFYCEKCGTQNEEGTKFCTNCGADLSMNGNPGFTAEENNGFFAAGEVPAPDDGNILFNPAGNVGGTGDVPGKKPIKKIIIALASVAAFIIVCILGYNLISGIFGKKSNKVNTEKHPVIYVKDDSVYLREYGKKKSIELSDSESLSNFRVSANGKKVFFVDSGKGDKSKLYYRYASGKIPKGEDSDETGYKISSEVNSYEIAPDGSFVLYRKDNKLYYSDFKKEDRVIAKDVEYFYLTEDSKKVLYDNNKGTYICGLKAKDEPEKIDSDISYCLSDIEDYKTIYYVKSSDKGTYGVYVKKLGKDKEKITSDVCDAVMIGDTIYVTKEDEKSETYTLYKVSKKELKKVDDNLSSYDISSHIITKGEDDDKKYSLILKNGKIIKLTGIDSETSHIKISDDEKYLYCIKDNALVRYAVSSSGLGSKVNIKDDVTDYKLCKDGVIVYTDDEVGVYQSNTYYSLGDKDSIQIESYNYDGEDTKDSAIFYFKDYEDGKGDLKRFKDGKNEEIASDVKYLKVRSDKVIYYLTDDDTLYRKNSGSKPDEIDTDVEDILY